MRYDRFKDQTTVTVGAYFLSSGMDLVMTNSRFELMASFTYDGQKLQRFDLGSAERDSDVHLGRVSEVLAVDVSFETFAKIANSLKVEMRFGHKEIKLKDEHLEGFRDLASRMIP